MGSFDSGRKTSSKRVLQVSMSDLRKTGRICRNRVCRGHVSKSNSPCCGASSHSSARSLTGACNSACARNNTAASASNAMHHVNLKLLKNICPNPSWFFSYDCAGSIQGRTCCNNRWRPACSGAKVPARSHELQARRRTGADRCWPASNSGTIGPVVLLQTNADRPALRSRAIPKIGLARR